MARISANYKNISASAQISARPCTLKKIIVNSCAATATIKVWDQTTAAVPVLLNTITYAAVATPSTGQIDFGPDGVHCVNGLYITIAVAAMDVTIIWEG